ncbi:MAG: flavin reductase family protein [Lachnospiraceae bacterium]
MEKQHWKPGNMLYPVPAVMVSCARPGEKPNILTVAWTGTVCTNPPMLSISVRPERYSYDILKETNEFVVNLTTKRLVRAADFCGVRSGREVDKYKEMHLTPLESKYIQAPGIAESPVNIECKVKQVLELGSHHLFLAEVLGVSVDAALLDEKGSLHLEKADLAVYSHGRYVSLGEQIGSFGYSVRKKADKKKKKTKRRK